jgi:hypothetical protein
MPGKRLQRKGFSPIFHAITTALGDQMERMVAAGEGFP